MNPGNPKPFNSVAVQHAFPCLEFFHREPVSPANLVRGNESTAHCSCNVRLVGRQPMFEVRWREVSERKLATIWSHYSLESPTFCQLLHLTNEEVA